MHHRPDQTRIVDRIPPQLAPVLEQPLGPADHDAAVRARVEVVHAPGCEINVVCRGELFPARLTGLYVRGGAPDGRDDAPVLREHTRRVRVAREHDAPRADSPARRLRRRARACTSAG